MVVIHLYIGWGLMSTWSRVLGIGCACVCARHRIIECVGGEGKEAVIRPSMINRPTFPLTQMYVLCMLCLYTGLGANLAGVTPEKAIKLAANDLLRCVVFWCFAKATIVGEGSS